MTPIISQQLIERCHRGDHTAQMELYSLLFASVYSSSLRITGNPSDAEEITQEAFLKIFRDVNRYGDRLLATLRRIAINASIDLLRKRRINFVELSPQHDVSQQHEDTQEFIDSDVEAIKRAIEELSPGYKLVITLRLIEQMSFEDIALQMCINQSTVRSQFVRAKHRVIELVQQYRREVYS